MADAHVYEGDSGQQTILIPVSLSEPLATDLLLKYKTVDQTATSPSDYKAKTGTLKIAAGKTNGTISVVVYGDTALDNWERFYVQITGTNQPGVVLWKDFSNVDIMDDDYNPDKQLNIADTEVIEGNAGTVTAHTIVTLTDPAPTDIKIKYTTTPYLASSPEDYLAKTGQIVIRAGKTTGTIATTVVGDTISDFGEHYDVQITSVSDPSYVVGGYGTVVINDDETRTEAHLAKNVVATVGAAPGSVDVSWSAPTAPPPEISSYGSYLAGYYPTISVDNGRTWKTVDGTPNTFITIYDVPVGTFRVRINPIWAPIGGTGFFTGESSDLSSPITLFVGAPTNVAITPDPVNDSTVTVTWSPPPSSWPITSYNLERSDDGGASWGLVTTTSATGAGVSSIANGTTLFRVSAVSAVSTGAPSAPGSFTATTGRPTSVRAVKSTSTPGTVDLTWANTPSTWYITRNYVEYSTDGGVTWLGYGDVSPTGSANIGPLAPGTYRFRVSASSSSGDSAPSLRSNGVTL